MCAATTSSMLRTVIVKQTRFSARLNRSFAFRAKGTPVAGQAVKFIISTLIAMSIHAPLVGILADWLDVPVVVAKLIADVLVFSIGQLLVLRFLVFRKTPHAQA